MRTRNWFSPTMTLPPWGLRRLSLAQILGMEETARPLVRVSGVVLDVPVAKLRLAAGVDDEGIPLSITDAVLQLVSELPYEHKRRPSPKENLRSKIVHWYSATTRKVNTSERQCFTLATRKQEVNKRGALVEP